MAKQEKNFDYGGGVFVQNDTLNVNQNLSYKDHNKLAFDQQRNKFGIANTISGQANILERNQSTVNATGFLHSNRHQDQFGLGLNMNSRGNSGSIGFERTPANNTTSINAGGKINLMTSPGGNMNIDATAKAMHHLSGPNRGQSELQTGVEFTYHP